MQLLSVMLQVRDLKKQKNFLSHVQYKQKAKNFVSYTNVGCIKEWSKIFEAAVHGEMLHLSLLETSMLVEGSSR